MPVRSIKNHERTTGSSKKQHVKILLLVIPLKKKKEKTQTFFLIQNAVSLTLSVKRILFLAFCFDQLIPTRAEVKIVCGTHCSFFLYT